MGYQTKMIQLSQNIKPLRIQSIMTRKYHNNLSNNCLQIIPLRRISVFLTSMIIIFSLTACADQGKTPDSQNNNTSSSNSTTPKNQDNAWINAFDNGQPSSSTTNQSAPADAPWTIVLATFGSKNHQQIAEKFRANLLQVSSMTGFLITSRSDRSIIHYGHYPTPDSPNAKSDLQRIHAITIDGRTPFARAFPSIVQPSDQGSYPQFNLVSLWKQFPRASAIYSLQIGFYTFDNQQSETIARQTAEKAVAQLRAAGEQAFYYHARTMSIVTVGIFFPQSVDPVTGYAPEIRQLQKKYPDNLADGKQLIETERLPGGKSRRNIQSSFLINVPKQ